MERDTELVIVALPSPDDEVRKVSSEKEPHLTLLYLGTPSFDQEQLAQVVEYIQHASSQLSSFVLDVEGRGELGEKKADVLFFNKNLSKEIASFRDHLRTERLIEESYLSSDQFPDWLPHLTLGYPDAPAKKGAEKYSSRNYVYFDRIALWTGDSTGPTFQLKRPGTETEVALSHIDRGSNAVSDVLAHYGVKGMKWGVHKSGSSGGSSASEDHRTVTRSNSRVEKAGGTHVLSNKELQGVITRLNLEQQYHTLASQKKTSLDRGQDGVKKALALGKTVEDVRRFANTPTGKAVVSGIKVAAAAAAGFATGGTSTAATAGASVAVRRMANHYTNTGS